MKAEIYVQVVCPECNLMMIREWVNRDRLDSPQGYVCRNRNCDNRDVFYEVPTIELKRLEAAPKLSEG